ncbi:uncharacterized protein LOC131946580 [Physella acuta]|uniref:uncharacterized protein LOC131946580 n=1 Tax=Physella acuta TaxID=109671 RepID=UPI0027DD9085|nr:uncharacterized protein LOC131946580 [Physella acuta]
MEIFVLTLLVLTLLPLLTTGAVTQTGQCYTFNGNSYLDFSPENFNNNNNAHYSFKFKTTQANGLLLYARGPHDDDEAVFLRNGKLVYHLFNTSPTGIEGYYGGLYQGTEEVNIDEWISVDIFRSWQTTSAGTGSSVDRQKSLTGLWYEVDGRTYNNTDELVRTDIALSPTVYVGGYRSSLSQTVGNFEGIISDLYEEKNQWSFEDPSHNFMNGVVYGCGGVAPL